MDVVAYIYDRKGRLLGGIRRDVRDLDALKRILDALIAHPRPGNLRKRKPRTLRVVFKLR